MDLYLSYYYMTDVNRWLCEVGKRGVAIIYPS